jgi:hypothetical protein
MELGVLSLSALLLFVGLGAPRLLLDWGSADRIRPTAFVGVVVVVIFGTLASIAVSLDQWTFVSMSAVLALSIYQLHKNKAVAGRLARTDEALKRNLFKAFAAWPPFLICCLWLYIAAIPALSRIPLIYGVDSHLEVMALAFATVFGYWITKTYRPVMGARNVLDSRRLDVAFGALYCYYGLMGSGVLLIGCLQVDLRMSSQDPTHLFAPKILAMMALSAMSTLLGLTLSDRRRARTAQTSLATIGALVGVVAVASIFAPAAFPIVAAGLVAVALIDSMVSNILRIHLRSVCLGRIVTVVAPPAVGVVGFCWYLFRVWPPAAHGTVSVAEQGMFLITVGVLNIGAMIAASHISRLPGEGWLTENSGTFNVAHDALLTYGCIILGMVLPIWTSMSGSVGSLMTFLLVIVAGAAGSLISIVRYSIENFQKHVDVPIVKNEGLSQAQREAWKRNLNTRQRSQIVALVAVILSGWVFFVSNLINA